MSKDKHTFNLPLPPDKINQISKPRYNLQSRYTVACAFLNQQTGELEEYPALIKGPDKQIWHNAYRIVHTDRYVHLKIRKGIPGLKQAGQIANKNWLST